MKLSVVIPCYNEASRGNFKKRIEGVLKYLKKCESISSFEVICVNDGSTDDTLNILQNFGNSIILISHNNKGKGYSLKRGFEICTGELCLMMDADLSVPLEYIEQFYLELRENKNLALIGSRRCDGAQILNEQSTIRRFIGKISRFITQKILGLDIIDTQCGFKMMRTKYVNNTIDKIHSNRWLFDIELLLYLQEQGIKLKETPVSWGTELESTLNSFSALITSAYELIIILITSKKNRIEVKKNEDK